MKTNKSKRQRDIKSMLMAAICMLLVSSIMMVSSTYAWFTLSTAPEVTGITTAVGANGNLEMALQPYNGDSDKITTSTGDGVLPIVQRNTTWGNLVDVSDNTVYGLNNVKLYPSQLNLVEGKIASAPLATPAYGADGRITELEKKTITGVYNPEGKFLEGYNGSFGSQTIALNKAYGVRAVGTSSGMSDRQLAYRAALAAANTAAEKAASSASQSLNAKGAALADIAIKHATADGNETYSVAELQSLQTILITLVGDKTTTGSLQHIENALIEYALAAALGNTTGVTDDNYADVVADFEAATLSTLVGVMEKWKVNESQKAVYDLIAADVITLSATVDKVTAAKGGIDGLLAPGGTAVANNTTFTWSQFSTYLTNLANPNEMQVNGIKVQDLKANWNVGADKYQNPTTVTDPLGNSYTFATYTEGETQYYVNDTGVVYELCTDSSNTANYNKYIPVSNMSRLVGFVLADGLQLIIGSGAGVYADIADFCGDYSASVKLSQISYGGMSVKNLDATMSTQTNQDTPYLTAVKNGVPTYFAGAGSTASAAISDYYGYIIDLAFRTNAAGSSLRLQQEAIDRIYSEGTSNEATMGHGASMTFTPVGTFTDNQVKSLMNCIRIVFFNTDDNTIIGYAKLDSEKATNPATGGIKMPLVMTDDKGVAKTGDDATIIMSLEQNTITELSVLVYLDGEKVTNADVATGASSMTGSMNLQFSSSAPLDPMDYTPLKEGTVETPAAPSFTAITDAAVTGGAATVYWMENGSTKGVLVVPTTENVTSVTVNSNPTQSGTYGSYTGFFYAVDTKPTAPAVALTVTANPNP